METPDRWDADRIALARRRSTRCRCRCGRREADPARVPAEEDHGIAAREKFIAPQSFAKAKIAGSTSRVVRDFSSQKFGTVKIPFARVPAGFSVRKNLACRIDAKAPMA